jgi:cytochrome c556
VRHGDEEAGMRRMLLVASGLALGVALMNVGVRAEQAQDAAVIDKAMKAVGPAFGALRKAVEAGTAAETKASADTLSKAMAETEAFFKIHGKADGVELAQAAKKAADAIAAGATGDAAKAAAGEIGKTCAGCHGKYRDRAADGTYTFKPGN